MALTTIPASLSATALTLTTAAQPNITSVGTLTGLTVSGNIAGTLTTAAQTNITSVGTLTGLVVNGNASIQTGALTLSGANPALVISNSGDVKVNFVRSSNTISYALSSAASGGHGFYDNAASAYDLYMKAGKVGIGTSSPLFPLHVSGSSTNYVMSETTGTGTSSGFRLKGDASADFTLFTTQGTNQFAIYDNANSAERMRIDSSGELTLGNPSGGSALQLDVSATGSDGVDIKGTYYTGSYGPIKFHTGGTERMRIDQNGTLLLTKPAGGAYGYLNVKEAGNGDVRFGMESGINYDAIAGTFTNNSMKFYTNSTERMQVLSSGDVGYSGKLFSSNVPGTLGGLQLYRNHANGECFLFDTTAAGPYDGPLIFGTSNTEAMRIKEGNGFVGIGGGTATNPRYNLTVAGNNSTAIGIGVDNASGSSTLDIAALGTGYNLHQAAAGEVWFYSPDNINIGGATGNTNDIKFIANNSINMRIRSSGVVTAPSQTYVQGRGSSGWSSFTQSWNIQPMGTPSMSVNRGTAYNTTTKRFTAPVDGVYLVIGSWYIYHPAASSRGQQYVHPAITVNGSLVWNGGQQPYTIFGHNNSDGSTTHMDGVNMAFTVYLSANDYVRQEVYSYSTNTQTYDLYHYFSYMLLH